MSDDYLATSTMADLGQRLIIGCDGNTDLEIRDWTTEETIALGDLLKKKQKQAASVGKKVTQWDMAELVVSMMCARFGPHVFWTRTDSGNWTPTLPAKEREAILRRSFLCDVMFAYMWIRVESQGPEFDVVIGDDRKVRANLLSVEVKAPTDLANLQWEYELSKPVTYGDKEIKSVIFSQTHWREKDSYATSNMAIVAMDIVAGSIVKFPDLGNIGAGGVTRSLLSKLRIPQREIRRMFDAVNDHACGPELAIDVEVDGEDQRHPIDWVYGSFFG